MRTEVARLNSRVPDPSELGTVSNYALVCSEFLRMIVLRMERNMMGDKEAVS